jgi:HPt (histidine-containing phosphotransfer) domain-containing protein
LAKESALMSTAHRVADSGDKLAGDPIDRAYLARFTMGNAAVEHEVLQLFADQVPLYLQQLRDASVDKAWQQAAHTIKGSASAIGAWRLARFAEMAEQVDIESDVALSEGHRDEAVAALATATDEVCRFIARLLGNP